MVTAKDIIPFKTIADDYEETMRLKHHFDDVSMRSAFVFLLKEDVEKVLRWKLRLQYGRQAKLREQNDNQSYEVVTRAVFSYENQDLHNEMQFRMKLLQVLPGIGMGVASAILALVEPEKYCVIDFRGWRAAFGETRRTFTLDDYWAYLQYVRKLASEVGWSMLETDLAMWAWDVENND